MRNHRDQRDLNYLRNQVDLINIRLEDLKALDVRKISGLMRRVSHIEDRLNGLKSVIDTKEAAEYLHISVPKLYKLIKKSGLPCYRTSRRYYFERGMIDQWLNERVQTTIDYGTGDENND